MGKSASLANLGSVADTPLSFRNKIINGNFDFWQRGTANGSTDAGGYLSDRWQRSTTGTTLSQSRQSFAVGQTEVPGEPAYFWQGVVTSSAGSSNYALLNQPIESVRTLAGQNAVLTFWAKADASKSMSVEFVQNFGTGGSPSAAVTAIGVQKLSLTTSWQKFTVPVTLPSISGKTLGTNGNDLLSVVFFFDAGSTFNSRTNSLGQQSGTFSIARVQLEPGTAATDFEVRPLQTELALCQRYYEKTYSIGTVPGTVVDAGAIFMGLSTNQYNDVLFSMPFIVQKRATPTMTFYNSATGASGTYRLDRSGATGSSYIVNNYNTNDKNCSFYIASTGAAWVVAWFVGHWTASAEL